MTPKSRQQYNAEMASNPLWKLMRMPEPEAEDDGDDDFETHMRVETRQGRFI